MDENSVYRKLMIKRFECFVNDSFIACRNEHHSPIYDILRVAIMFNMMGIVARMIRGTHFYSKGWWKREVWRNAWLKDNNDWMNTAPLFRDTYYLNSVLDDTTMYLAWWELSNQRPEYMNVCENMSRLVCRCSNLKSDCVMIKGTNLSVRSCEKCCNFHEENLEHMVMHCPSNNETRSKMLEDISTLENRYGFRLNAEGDMLMNLMGKRIIGVDSVTMLDLWAIAGTAVNRMYLEFISERERTGVG